MLYGKVGGQFTTEIVDTEADPDSDPEQVALTGQIKFTLNASKIIYADAVPNPVAVITRPFIGVLDGEGRLSTPLNNGTAGVDDLTVLANDDPGANPTSTQYLVEYDLKGPGGYPYLVDPHLIVVPAGSRIDLVLVTPPVDAPALGTAAAEAAAAIAVQAALQSTKFIELAIGEDVPEDTLPGTIIVRT